MGDGSVAAATSAQPTSARHSWQLKPETNRQTQGLVVSPFADLPAAEALFLTLPDGANGNGGAWLRQLRASVPISAATGRTPSAAAVAFTWTGLQTMGVDRDALQTFSAPFREGMHQVDRQRRLGDDQPAMVIQGGARWSGNTPDPLLTEEDPQAPRPAQTPITVHAVLLLYRKDDNTLDADIAPVLRLLQQSQVVVTHRLRLSLFLDATGTPREHFGFADGISQPVPIGDAIVAASGPGAAEQRKWHGVAAGEILMGHRNAHHEPAPGPLLAAHVRGADLLPSEGAPEGFRNLGLNGTYLVIRELHQDVARFWSSMHAASAQRSGAIGEPHVDADWIAEHVVGRTRDGDPLAPYGTIPRQHGEAANNFGFAERDLHGFGCPLGAHIRRANPRDSLPSRDGPKHGLLEAVQSHRLLRRGRKFGVPVTDRQTNDGQERGLLFMCLNTDLTRHFEFVQQTWLLNLNFATLFGETDPLLGPAGPFTIPRTPLRDCPTVETFIRFAGGEYFFLPSIPALDYLSAL